MQLYLVATKLTGDICVRAALAGPAFRMWPNRPASDEVTANRRVHSLRQPRVGKEILPLDAIVRVVVAVGRNLHAALVLDDHLALARAAQGSGPATAPR